MDTYRLAFLILLLSETASGMCTKDDNSAFRICGKSTTEFENWKGNMWISPEDVADLQTCECSIQSAGHHLSTFVLAPLGTRSPEETPVNFSFTHGNRTLTDIPSSFIFATSLDGSDEISLLLQQRRQSSASDQENQYCFGFSTTRENERVTIMCNASFIPDPTTSPNEESRASLGVILGPTITVFILVDIVIIGVVFYIMKKKMKNTARWRPQIEHTVNPMKETSVAMDNRLHSGNNYVGIRPKDQTGKTEQQPLGEEYEDVHQPNIIPHDRNADIILPQKKPKSWFVFKKSRGPMYSETKTMQATDEYEDVQTSNVQNTQQELIKSAGKYQPESYQNVNKLGDQFGRNKNQSTQEDKKFRKPERPRVDNEYGKQQQVPPDEWTPADEYEEVHVKAKKPGDVKTVKEGFVPKDSYETMGDLRSALDRREKSQRQMKAVVASEAAKKPTECYEDMHPPQTKSAKKWEEKSQGGSEKLKTETKKPQQSTKASSLQGSSLGQIPTATYDNLESIMKQPRANKGKASLRSPPYQGKDGPGFRPTEAYDNVEMCPKQPNRKGKEIGENLTDTETPPSRRQRSQTEPPDATQAYDNFDHIAEQRRQARAGSRKASTKKF